MSVSEHSTDISLPTHVRVCMGGGGAKHVDVPPMFCGLRSLRRQIIVKIVSWVVCPFLLLADPIARNNRQGYFVHRLVNSHWQ
jgi:hypothetical protein